ncbi:MAG: fibronectin type III domain-containing protein [Pseudomonadales bacterium]|nr:fibronectin type III domain-containing protein [Pseudomonadales bacterium]
MHKYLPYLLVVSFFTEAALAEPLVVNYPNRKEAIGVQSEVDVVGDSFIWALNEAGAIRYKFDISANTLNVQEVYNPGDGLVDARVKAVITDDECDLFTTASSGASGCRIFATPAGLSMYIQRIGTGSDAIFDTWQNYRYHDATGIPEGNITALKWLNQDITDDAGSTTSLNHLLVGTKRHGMASCGPDQLQSADFNAQGIATRLSCTPYNTTNYEDFPDDSVNDFELDSFGRLWVATGLQGITPNGSGGIGVARYNPSNESWDWDWTESFNTELLPFRTTSGGLPHNYVNAITLTEDNVMWAGFSGWSLSLYNAGQLPMHVAHVTVQQNLSGTWRYDEHNPNSTTEAKCDVTDIHYSRAISAGTFEKTFFTTSCLRWTGFEDTLPAGSTLGQGRFWQITYYGQNDSNIAQRTLSIDNGKVNFQGFTELNGSFAFAPRHQEDPGGLGVFVTSNFANSQLLINQVPGDLLNANDIRSLNVVTDVDGSEFLLVGAMDPRKPMLTTFNGQNITEINTLLNANGSEVRTSATMVDADIEPTTGTRWWISNGMNADGSPTTTGNALACKLPDASGWTFNTNEFGSEVVLHMRANANGDEMGYKIWEYVTDPFTGGQNWEVKCENTTTASQAVATCNMDTEGATGYVRIYGNPSIYRVYSGGTLALSEQSNAGQTSSVAYFTVEKAQFANLGTPRAMKVVDPNVNFYVTKDFLISHYHSGCGGTFRGSRLPLSAFGVNYNSGTDVEGYFSAQTGKYVGVAATAGAGIGLMDSSIGIMSGNPTMYTQANGLLSNGISVLEPQVVSGSLVGLWIGGSGGIQRLDISNFTFNELNNLPEEVAHSRPGALATLSDGSLAIGTQSGSVIRYHGNYYSTLTPNDGVIRCGTLATDSNDNIWCAGDRGETSQSPMGLTKFGEPFLPSDVSTSGSTLSWNYRGHLDNHISGGASIVHVFRATSPAGPFERVARSETTGSYVETDSNNGNPFFYKLGISSSSENSPVYDDDSILALSSTTFEPAFTLLATMPPKTVAVGETIYFNLYLTADTGYTDPTTLSLLNPITGLNVNLGNAIIAPNDTIKIAVRAESLPTDASNCGGADGELDKPRCVLILQGSNPGGTITLREKILINVIDPTDSKQGFVTHFFYPEDGNVADGFLIHGKVSPPPATNFTLIPTFYKNNVAQANPVGNITIAADGSWKYFFQATEQGTWKIINTWAGETGRSAVSTEDQPPLSPPDIPVAIQTTSIQLSVGDLSSINVGSSVTLSGSISPNPGAVSVDLNIANPDGSWVSRGSVTSNTLGQFSTTFNVQQTGVFEVGASWAGNSNFSNSSGELAMGVQQSTGMFVILAGGGTSSSRWTGVDTIATYAYNSLIARNIPASRIRFFHPEHGTSNAPTGSYGDASRTLVLDAIETWAANLVDVSDASAPSGTPLTIILADSGIEDYIYTNTSETMSASQLNTSLGTFLTNVQARFESGVTPPASVPVNIIIESNKSGSFIDDIAGANRFIFTATDGSADPNGKSNLGSGGVLSFTYQLMNQLSANQTLSQAFTTAQSTMTSYYNDQIPQLEASGNTTANESADQLAVSGIYLQTHATSNLPPTIVAVGAPTNTTTSNATSALSALVTDPESSDVTVKATIIPPGDADISSSVQTLSYSGSASTYNATATGLTAAGVYEVVYTATDTAGNLSNIKTANITVVDDTPPDAPSNFTVIGESSGTLQLNWKSSGSSDVLGYKIYSTYSGGATSITDNGSDTTATLNSLETTGYYTLSLVAYDKDFNESSAVLLESDADGLPHTWTVPAMGSIGLLALGLSMLGLGAVRLRKD